MAKTKTKEPAPITEDTNLECDGCTGCDEMINRIEEAIDKEKDGGVRMFQSGATRSPLKNKLQYEGFLNPLVLKRYAEYMHKHQMQENGELREADNWQKGIPKDSTIDSMYRHFIDLQLHHRGFSDEATESLQDSLCAIIFNAMSYLLEEMYDTGRGFKE